MLQATAVACGKHIWIHWRRLRSPNVPLFCPTVGDSGRPHILLQSTALSTHYGLYTVFLHTAHMRNRFISTFILQFPEIWKKIVDFSRFFTEISLVNWQSEFLSVEGWKDGKMAEQLAEIFDDSGSESDFLGFDSDDELGIRSWDRERWWWDRTVRLRSSLVTKLFQAGIWPR